MGGPEWIKKEISDWPKSLNRAEITQKMLDQVEEKETQSRVIYHMSLANINSWSFPAVFRSDLGMVLTLTAYSSLSRLLRVTAWILRFLMKCLPGIRGKILTLPKKEFSDKSFLSLEELESGKELWIRHVQRASFSGLDSYLMKQKNGKKLGGDEVKAWSKFSIQLGLTIDQTGIIHCFGRYANVQISDKAKTPTLLPRDHWFSKLVIRYFHGRLAHSGVAQTLMTLREEYWIPHGRAVVRKEIYQCGICRKVEGGPYKMPLLASWPKERVSRSLPFTYCGVDYFGPILVFSDDLSQMRKVWVVLFTCMAVRAVHMEIVQDMSTREFLYALECFISRRGCPRSLISDNALQFHLVDKMLKGKEYRNAISEVADQCSQKGIAWKFIPELSPWAGGFYERMIGLVKRCLKKMVGHERLSEPRLRALIAKSEAVVNSRPLLYVGEGWEPGNVLTPASFLNQNSPTGLPPLSTDEDVDFRLNVSRADTLLEQWKSLQALLDRFWKVFQADYLTSLRERQQLLFRHIRSESRQPAVGDVVLIKENLPRSQWKFGRIEELIEGTDGEVRAVRLKTPKRKTLVRPPSLLYPIECPANEAPSMPTSLKQEPRSQEAVSEKEPRPKRQAAVRARQKLLGQC